MFTKQHYDALVAVILATREEMGDNAEELDPFVVNLATALQEDNHNFNVIEFLCACDLPTSFAASVTAGLAHDLAAKLASKPLDERMSEHTCDTDCECWDDPALTAAIQLAVATGEPVLIRGVSLADLFTSQP